MLEGPVFQWIRLPIWGFILRHVIAPASARRGLGCEQCCCDPVDAERGTDLPAVG